MINDTLLGLYKTYYGDGIKNIALCGVVDEKSYLSVNPRILFLLREPHSEKGGFSIPNGLNRNVQKGFNNKPFEKGYMYTWRQAGVWAYALIYGFESYRVLKKDEYVAKGLQSISMTNLKKEVGGASSNKRVINKHANKDKDLWLRELEIMNPDIIITGNYNDVTENLNIDKISLLKTDNKTFYYSILVTEIMNTIILDFWHPNNRLDREENLKTLKLLTDELKQRGYLLGGN
jgi:hypothetical protein